MPKPVSPGEPAFTERTRMRIKNRRRRYLGLRPSYFSPYFELADPLLYDCLIRRFQSAVGREAECKSKCFGGPHAVRGQDARAAESGSTFDVCLQVWPNGEI
jgi:hypothetical protein